MSQRTFAFMNRVLTYDMRSLKTALVRAFSLAAVIFTIYLIQIELQHKTDQGLVLFKILTYFNLFFIGFVSLNDYASVITEEKEHQMLGLLLMTGINPFGILIGKSIPRQMNSLLLLTIQFPFTLLAITLGGVNYAQVFAAYCTLGSFLFFIANLGLLFSVISKDTKASRDTLFSTVILMSIIPGVLSVIGIFSFNFITTLGYYLSLLHPVNRLNTIMQTGFQDFPIGIEFYAYLLGGGICLFLSWLVFENLILINESRESTSIEKSRPFQTKGKRWKRKNITLLKRASERSWNNALGWKHFHFTLRGAKAIRQRYLFFIIVILFITAGMYLIQLSGLGPPTPFVDRLYVIVTIIQVLAFIMLLMEPVLSIFKLYSDEFQHHTYDGIYMLPMNLKQKTWYKFKGGLSMMIPSAIFLVLGIILYPKELLELVNQIMKNQILIKVLLIFFSSYLMLLSTVFFSSLFQDKSSIFANWATFKLQVIFILFLFFYVIAFFLIFYFNQKSDPSGYEFVVINLLFILATMFLIKKAMITRTET